MPSEVEALVAESNATDENTQALAVYMGVVLAINDPQQMKRCRVRILGIDEGGLEIQKYRWIPVMVDMAGLQEDAPMGPEKQITPGFTSYGRFGMPKVGARVLVAFIAGRLSNPVIIGMMPPHDMISGLPAGNQGKNEKSDRAPQDITRTKTRMDQAFGTPNSEVKATRGFDVTGRAPGYTSDPFGADADASGRAGPSDVADGNLKTGGIVGDRSKFGYPEAIGTRPTPATPIDDVEPMMYSFTTPGQHTLLMNDDPDNCRVRLRTVSGNQLILDDTNQRIYLSVGTGQAYLEFDEDGHGDLYVSRRLSIHAGEDINIKSDKQVNIEGAEGVNIKGGKDVKISSSESVDVKAGKSAYTEAGQNIHEKAGQSHFTQAGQAIHQGSRDSFKETVRDLHMKAGGNTFYDAAGTMDTQGRKGVRIDPGTGIVDLGNGAAPASGSSDAEGSIEANPVNRTPQHESTDWRQIGPAPQAIRSDAAQSAHKDKSPVNVYDVKAQGGKQSIKRPLNWRK